MSKDYPEHCFTKRESIASCPKCLTRLTEIWLTHTKSGISRKKPKRLHVVCMECRYDLASTKQPEGPLMIKIK